MHQCSVKVWTEVESRKQTLSSQQFAAGGKEGEDACTGDGGGPLVCPVFQPQIEDDINDEDGLNNEDNFQNRDCIWN